MKINLFLYLLISFLSIFFFLKNKKLLNILDYPSTRKIHKKPIPLIGGFVIFVCLIFFVKIEKLGINDLEIILTYSLIYFFIGALDDIKNLNYQTKLILFFVPLIQILNSISLQDLGYYNYLGTLNLGNLKFFTNCILVIFLINALNYADGIDGNAIILFVTSFILILFFTEFKIIEINYYISFFVIILIPVYIFNIKLFTNYQIFLGNSGSYMLGFILSFFLIFCAKNRIIHPILLATSISIITFDCLDVTIRRILGKKKLFVGDNLHAHHILINKFNHIQSSLLLGLLNLLIGFLGFFIFKKSGELTTLLYFVLCFIVFFIIKTYFLKRLNRNFSIK